MPEIPMSGFPRRESALRDYFEAWEPRCTSEVVALDSAVGRVSAAEVYARLSLPVVRSSSCDGIAVRSACFAGGPPDTSAWRLGVDYVRADTGDDFPDEFDAVILIEKASIQDDGSVVLEDGVEVRAGTDVKEKGSTIKEGELLVRAHARLRAVDVAVLAMGGYDTVEVLCRPRVAFIPTGSELVAAGTVPERGQNIDTNSLMVKHMLIEMGVEPLVSPIIKDDEAALNAALDEALECADIIILNGGSAVGEEDYNTRLVGARGQIIHHYVATVPGRPTLMGVVEGKPVLVLPGPPAAAYYATDWCVRAVVERWLGVAPLYRARIEARFDKDVKCYRDMANLVRLDVTPDAAGGYSAVAYNPRRGELVRTLTSNAQYVSPYEESSIPAGAPVQVELLL